MHKPLYRTARGLVTAAVALVLAACAVGPDYHRPDVPTPDNFVSADASFSANDVEQDFWSAFDDAQLNDLIERALAANHDVRIAAARLREARALRGEARLDLAPTVTASASWCPRTFPLPSRRTSTTRRSASTPTWRSLRSAGTARCASPTLGPPPSIWSPTTWAPSVPVPTFPLSRAAHRTARSTPEQPRTDRTQR